MTEEALSRLRLSMHDYMDEQRYRHTLGVEEEMRRLAASLLPGRIVEAAAAGLLHDLTKCLSPRQQLDFCQEHGIEVDEDERLAPALLHAKTGAYFAKLKFPELATEDVLTAIACHTTAKAPLSLLSAMLFVADFTERGRTYPECVALREALYSQNLSGDSGIAHFKNILLKAVDLSLGELLAQGRPIALQSVTARNEILANRLLF